ncbi:MAG: hypothetical protein F6J93_01485 [Oscillatoria sp. SIO1A7]|nr:hypothetical protein [Oscillatoria sp. SIO1A7]
MNWKIADFNAQRRKQFISLVMKRVRPGTGSGLDFIKKRTWTYPVTDIKAIVNRTSFVVVGGIATRLYMPERMTLDLDILVLARDARSLYAELEKAGSRKIGELGIPGSQWELPDLTSLDVLESNADWARAAIATPNTSPNGLPIIALPYLVLMKLQSARTQDLSDVSRMMGVATSTEIAKVKEIVSQYLPGALEDLESLIVLGKLELK